jgi:MFS-type transporter involved in bile tolerance (Atg22 family)
MKRIMIFIDGSNMYKNMMGIFGKASLNYNKFSLKLRATVRTVVRLTPNRAAISLLLNRS